MRSHAQRDVLRDVSRDISLPEILGTRDGIEALTEFLRESGAFSKTGLPRKARDLPRYEDEPEVPLDSEDEGDDDFG